MTRNSMEPEGYEDVERLLRQVREQANGPDVEVGDVWAFAAGELAPRRAETVAAAIIENRAAMDELGVASFVLEAAAGGTERSVDVESVMNEIHRRRAADASAVRVRRQWLRGGVAAGLAAAAIVIATFWTSPRVNWTWSATDVVANSTRGEPATGVGYRVTLAPDTTSHALLFCVTFVDGRQDIERLHPPRPSVLATTQYRNWPSEPFAAGVSVTIPPSWSFGLTTNEGYLLLFTQTDGAFDEPTIEAIETTIRTALRASGRTGTAAIESLALELQADGRQVEWRPIRVP